MGSWEVDHASGAPALALNACIDGHTFGYSGDTAWTPALIAAAANTERFACETYTYDKSVPYHLDYGTLCEHSRDFDTGQLVLTHMGSTMLEQLAQVTQTVAYDGLALSI